MLKLDLTYLESISGGDKAFLKEMLSLCITSTIPELNTLKQQAAAGLWENMSSTAHKIKAPIQMLGVPEVSALIVSIEATGKSTTTKLDIDLHINQLELYFKELETSIQKYLES